MIIKNFIPLVLLLAGCASKAADAPPPQWIIGSYQYSGTGVVAKKFPWDAQSNLTLERDGQYTLSIAVHINDDKGGDTDNDDSYGTYYVDGKRLILQPANDGGGDKQEFAIHGKQLTPKVPWPARVAMKGFKVPDPVFVKID